MVWSCSATVSRRYLTSLQCLIPRPSLSLPAIICCLPVVVDRGGRYHHADQGDVVKVELGLAGIIERHKVCQGRLHNHSFWQYVVNFSSRLAIDHFHFS